MLLILFSMFLSIATAGQPDRFLCNATCLSIDLNAQQIEIQGQVTGTSQMNIIEALQDMTEQCAARSSSKDQMVRVALAKSLKVWVKKASSGGGSSWVTSDRFISQRFGYQGASQQRGGSSFYSIDNEMQVEVQFASPLDREVCGEVHTDPNGKPKPPKPRPAPAGSLG